MILARSRGFEVQNGEIFIIEFRSFVVSLSGVDLVFIVAEKDFSSVGLNSGLPLVFPFEP